MRLIGRGFRCVAWGAFAGLLMAMVVAAVHARPVPNVDQDGSWLDDQEATMPSSALMLLTVDGGVWVVRDEGVEYVNDGRKMSVALAVASVSDAHGRSTRVAAVDAYDDSLWVLCADDVVVRVDIGGGLHIGTRVGGGVAMAIGVDQRPWLAVAGALIRLDRDGMADLRVELPDTIAIERLGVDSLRNTVVASSRSRVDVVAVDDGGRYVLWNAPPQLSGIRGVALDPIDGAIWILVDDRIDRYSSKGDYLGLIDLTSHTVQNVPFESMGYDGNVDAFIVAGLRRTVAFDRAGRWVPWVDLSAFDPYMGTAPLRLLPSVGISESAPGVVLLSRGATCNSAACNPGDVYTRSIEISASIDGVSFAGDALPGRNDGLHVIGLDWPDGETLSVQPVDTFGHVGAPSTLTLTESNGHSMLKANQAPTVAITSPANNATYPPGSSIALTAAASDADGSVAKVEFFRGSTLIGTVTTAPYALVWSNVAAGSYVLTAKATDDKGATRTSSSVNVVVKVPPNVAPTISITSPAAGATVNGPVVTIAANASDADGTVMKVEFFEGVKLLGAFAAALSTVSATWSYADIAPGVHTIRVVATDNAGATASATVTFTVNAAPYVVMTSPVACGDLPFGSPIALSADAYDTDGAVSKVDFYNGATLLGTATSAPYRFLWNSPPLGQYSLTAVATDTNSASRRSNPVSIAVRNANVPPAVVITSPTSGARFGVGVPINVIANATDSDGTVRKVDFYAGTSLIGSVNAAPYAVTWTSSGAGNYVITAKATDDRTVTTTSAPVTVSVIVNTPPSVSITAPVDEPVLGVGESVDLVATATDADGTIRKVDFFVDDEHTGPTRLIGTATSPPFTVRFAMDKAGAHYWAVARATDDLGATTTSYVKRLWGNTAPTVTITSPTEGQVFLPGAEVKLSARVADIENNISGAHAEVWDTRAPVWVSQVAKYDSVTHEVTFGRFFANPNMDLKFWVRAWDNKNAQSDSVPVRFSIATPPTVEFLSPRDGDTVVVPGSVKFSVKVAQPLGNIVRVEYYNDQTLIGTVTTPPYDFTWTGVPFEGTTRPIYLHARAVDNLGTGGVGYSDGIQVSVDPLRLAITSPPNDFVSEDPIVHVKGIYSEGSPTSITVNGVAARFGNGAFEADVTLAAGVNNWIKVVAVTPIGTSERAVVGGLNTPSLTLNAPQYSTLYGSGAVEVSAVEGGFIRPIKRVEYLSGGAVAATAFGPPWRAALHFDKIGDYQILARAIKANDAAVYSRNDAYVRVMNGVGAIITSPHDDSVARPDLPLYIRSSVRAPEGQHIVLLEVLMDGLRTAVESVATESIDWVARLYDLQPGRHVFVTRAVDSAGTVYLSDPVRVTLAGGPTVTLVEPRANASYRSGTSVVFTPNPVPADVPIASVDYLVNDRLVGIAYSAPFSYAWNNVEAGDYQLVARVHDNNFLSATSAAVPFTVSAAALNIEQPVDQAVVYEPFVVVGGTYDSVAPPQSIVVNGVAAGMANGLYAARVPVSLGNNTLTVAAAFGTVNVHRAVIINRAAPTISFTNVANGAVVHDDTVTLRGIVRGPRNSAVLVNGIPASIASDGDFFVSDLPLATGSNALRVQLVSQDDATVVEQTLTLVRDDIQPFVVSVSPAIGYRIPFEQMLTLRMRFDVDYARIQVLDGDTVVMDEEATGDKYLRQYQVAYNEYGTRQLIVRVVDTNLREVFRRAVVLRITKPGDVDAEIRAFYRNHAYQVAAGDAAGASSAYLPQLQADYRATYEDLGPAAAEFVQTMQKIASVTFGDGFAEIVVMTTEGATNRGYPIGLIKDSKGIWRISGM